MVTMPLKKIILVGIYLEGIYPRGDNSVEANLLAPAILKAAADADLEIAEKYEIKVLNLPASLSNQEVAQMIVKENPVAVGFSAYVWNMDLITGTAKRVRSTHPKIITFVGGPEVTNSAVDVLDSYSQFDFIIGGSGEERFNKILKNNLNPEAEPQIPGITYRNSDGKTKKIQVTKPIPEDLSKVPSPYQTGVINLNDGKRHCVFIETYRGCIFKCGYCMWMGEMQDKRLNLFPIDQILKDIEIIYNNPNVDAVVFTDACIFYTRERAMKITETIAACKYKIPTILTLDIAFMDEDAVRSLQKLDLSHQGFHFGMQSVNLETMRLMSRKIGPKIFKKRVEMLRKIDPNIQLSLDLIYGLPGDNFDTFRKTVDFALSLSPIKLNLSPLILLPGSTYWREREKHQFVYEKEPPFLVHSNRTYTAEDFRKTRKLVLGIIMIMYFPSILNIIYKMSEDYIDEVISKASLNNDFKSDNSKKDKTKLTRIDLIEIFVEKFEKRSNLLLDVEDRSDTEQYSVKEYDYIRKSTMDEVAKPENGLHAYEAMRDILEEAGRMDLLEEINLGIDYYQLKCSGKSVEGYSKKYGWTKIKRIQFNWVVSSKIENDQEYKYGADAI